VNKLGKILDALGKWKEDRHTAVATIESPETVASGQPETQAISLNKALSDKKPTVLSDKECNDIENDGPEIVYNSNNFDKNLVALLKPQSFEAEAFKMLRSKLLFPVSGKVPRSILVTSAVASEGKSFVASNLAVSIAQSIQEHVLLIDCDMRKPTIHRQFGFDDGPGLSEHLSKGTSLPSLLLNTKISKLSILPAGKPPQNPSELLSSRQMSSLLQEVKNRYSDRYIVIDTPPPNLTAETSAISRLVDGALLVIESRTTPRKMVSDLVEILGKEKILCVIFNKYDMRLSRYYGYGKYSKYSKYYAA
jgi:exopolysaccharide/PEP-CTERM locus tyrosine autokinase